MTSQSTQRNTVTTVIFIPCNEYVSANERIMLNILVITTREGPPF